MLRSLQATPETATSAITEVMAPLAADPEQAVGSVSGGPADDKVMAQAEPPSVGAPVSLHYGEDDTAIPPAHGRYWQSVLADAELRVAPAAGHLLPLIRWADILRSLRDS